jgi:Na+/H+ antiporter NhaD/arsenite permease-like protein
VADQQIITLAIFLISYIGLAFGGIPKLKIDRAEIAFIGALAMLIFTPMTLQAASLHIDYSVICLLFAMMVIVAYLDISGFIKLAIYWINKRCVHPISLLIFTIILSGVLSAFFINDVICIAMTPLILHICHKRHLPSIPYLLGVGTAANIGSAATITGNPQNILIAGYAQIPYIHFILKAAPIALIGLVIDFVLIFWFYRKDLHATIEQQVERADNFVIENKALFYKSVLVALAVIILFLTPIPLSTVALCGAAIMLFGKTPPKYIYRLIDWPLLLLFISLFVIVGNVEHNVLHQWHIGQSALIQHMPKFTITIASIILSNTVSNVPAALLFKPVILNFAHPQHFAILLAVMSTLAGNLTILGSVANLIVVGQAKRRGITISFWAFFKLGVPLTFLTCLVAYLFL